MSTISLQSVLYELPLRSLEKLLASIENLAIPAGVTLTLRTGDCSATSVVPSQVESEWRERLRVRGIEWEHTFFGENLGFGRGQNRLASTAMQADAYLVLNPDALPPFHLVDRLWAHTVDGWGIVEARQIPLEHPKEVGPNGQTPWSSGCCALYHGATFREIGGFDEEFFLYGEDVDLSLRMRDKGRTIHVALDTCVYHAKRLGRQGPEASSTELAESKRAMDLLLVKYGKNLQKELQQRWTYRVVEVGANVDSAAHLVFQWEPASQASNWRGYLDTDPADLPHPFVSIIVRTTGTRNELLTEALLSIYAQREDNYEVLLMVHLQKGRAPASVAKLAGRFPKEFADKVRVVEVIGGGRSRPLNEGIDHAAGDYICFLDDDDLLFDHHLTVVAEALRADFYQTFAARRWVSSREPTAATTETPNTEHQTPITFPYTATEIQPYYIEPYSLITQLNENVIPICNFFISRAAIDEHNLRFDESYEVREDWKFVMDAIRQLGVVTIPEVTTAISVRSNASNTLSDPAFAKLWDESRLRLRQELGEREWVLSESERTELRDAGLRFDEEQLDPGQMRELISASAPIYAERQTKKAEEHEPSLFYRTLRVVLTPVWSLRHKLPKRWKDKIIEMLLKEKRTL